MEGYETETAQLRVRLAQVEKLYNRSLLNVSSKFTAPMSAEKSGPVSGGTSGDKGGQKSAVKSNVVKGGGVKSDKLRMKSPGISSAVRK